MTLRTWLLFLALAAAGALAFFAVPRLEGDPPAVAGLEDGVLGKEPREIEIRVADAGAGLRRVELLVQSPEGSKTLETRTYPGSLAEGGEVADDVVAVRLDADALELPDGEVTLSVVATDWSLRGGLDGNQSEATATWLVDTVPPRVAATSGLTYVHRGGSAAVVYRVSGDAATHGVRVADTFFPGRGLPTAADPDATAQGQTVAVAIFGVPVDAPEAPSIRVVARDEAGNESAAGFAVRLLEREFADRDLQLSDSFLEQRAVPLAQANGFDAEDPVQAFRDVNETLRERSERRIREAMQGAPRDPLFDGRFEQMENSAVTSRFAERRRYLVDDREVSRATHYGFDLASTAGAKVTSANAGVVTIAEDLGIYGNCVVVDHGLGVHSLYGHLSSIDVGVGDRVDKGDVLGRSGMTGLAGGDHLHFAILVGDVYVDPMEWWDPKWMESHVEAYLPN